MLKNTILFPLATSLSNLIFVTAVCVFKIKLKTLYFLILCCLCLWGILTFLCCVGVGTSVRVYS